MKKTDLLKVHAALLHLSPRITVPENVADKGTGSNRPDARSLKKPEMAREENERTF